MVPGESRDQVLGVPHWWTWGQRQETGQSPPNARAVLDDSQSLSGPTCVLPPRPPPAMGLLLPHFTEADIEAPGQPGLLLPSNAPSVPSRPCISSSWGPPATPWRRPSAKRRSTQWGPSAAPNAVQVDTAPRDLPWGPLEPALWADAPPFPARSPSFHSTSLGGYEGPGAGALTGEDPSPQGRPPSFDTSHQDSHSHSAQRVWPGAPASPLLARRLGLRVGTAAEQAWVSWGDPHILPERSDFPQSRLTPGRRLGRMCRVGNSSGGCLSGPGGGVTPQGASRWQDGQAFAGPSPALTAVDPPGCRLPREAGLWGADWHGVRSLRPQDLLSPPQRPEQVSAMPTL